MRVIKTKNKTMCHWNDIFLYHFQLFLYYLAFLIPFPFMFIYGTCIDFNLNKPYDPRYKYEFIPDPEEVVDEFGNDYYYK